jgi:hypothetical protein
MLLSIQADWVTDLRKAVFTVLEYLSDGLATATLLLTLSRFDQNLFRRNNSHADSLA